MTDFTKAFAPKTYSDAAAGVFKHVYGWMAAGLALSGLVAYYATITGVWQTVFRGPVFLTLAVVEILMVVVLCACVEKIPVAVAYLVFCAYAALNGLTLSVVFLAYELSSIASVFFITAGTFGGIALYGTATNADLTKVGSLCGMALWGLILAMLVNLFVGNGLVDFAISCVSVLVFTGLTAYDAQKIRRLAEKPGVSAEYAKRFGILGALTLYLDFVNLFLHLLRLFGKIKK